MTLKNEMVGILLPRLGREGVIYRLRWPWTLRISCPKLMPTTPNLSYKVLSKQINTGSEHRAWRATIEMWLNLLFGGASHWQSCPLVPRAT